MDPAINELEFNTREPKGKAQQTQYIQDVVNSLFNKFKKELQDETLKQYSFSMHGEGGPDVSPPSGFVLFARAKLMCNRFIETHLCNSNDQVCKEWVEMGELDRKPWNDSSKQLIYNWNE